MAADPSAYAVLGLEPGADAAAIEQAYRRLIKQHHPDREGGNAGLAAAINSAYRDIRTERHLSDPFDLNDGETKHRRGAGAWLSLVLLLAVATSFLLLAQGPLAPLIERFGSPAFPRPAGGRSRASPSKTDPMDRPLHLAVIDAAVRDALRLSGTSDEMALARTSRDCHHKLRTHPNLLQLDHCAGFDDAVVQLQDRDPLRDQGPFSELGVTGRVWSGATALSDDSVAIDGRLDRIRLRVELALAGSRPRRNASAGQMRQ